MGMTGHMEWLSAERKTPNWTKVHWVFG